MPCTGSGLGIYGITTATATATINSTPYRVPKPYLTLPSLLR